MSTRLMAWHQRPRESEEAYEAFQIYLDLEKRRLQPVADKLNKSISLISRWSTDHEWRARARAYENAMMESKILAKQKAVVAFQDSLLIDESQDYNQLITKWRDLLEDHSGSIEDLQKLVQIRAEIDKMGRRIAELPTTYRQQRVVEEQEEHDREAQLSWDDVSPKMIEGTVANAD